MRKVSEIISLLKEQWLQPREAVHRGRKCPFLLTCSFSVEPADVLGQLPLSIPKDVLDFWIIAQSATLFKDQQYGQWGIELLDPAEALAETARQRAARPREFENSDLVLARFFGDSDLMVVVCDPNQTNFGSVSIALPIDKRSDWPVVARSLGEFLERLVEAQGDKFWEARKQ